ncbi:hypothetical protein EJ08DRAFT_680952 [Tothia fuscella]|uniref:RRM domain-containing protein n=1 Tax=Tothia fuscella TaxID=1048955 RepID=A0A9P4NMD0_9PEZI|nr:hypothetical protein EJ08DRAFT_680952 [Tothia fuscella]
MAPETSKKRKHGDVSDTAVLPQKKSKKVKKDFSEINGTNGAEIKDSPQQDKSTRKNKSDKREKVEKKSMEMEIEVESGVVEEDDEVSRKAEKQARKDRKRAAKEAQRVKQSSEPPSSLEDPPSLEDLPTDAAIKAAKQKAKKIQQKVKLKAAYEDARANGEVAPKKVEAPGPKLRFIVFVGNLPFTATLPTLTNHFKKLAPKSIRLINDKASGKCKGIAFVEFADWDRMNTAIEKYHHTSFDDGISPARKINIELTSVPLLESVTRFEELEESANSLNRAGGGGKSESRKAKIKEKNEKLHVERQNKQKLKVEGAEGGEGKDVHDGIHPSRRAQIGV